jgi:hypothetical protein
MYSELSVETATCSLLELDLNMNAKFITFSMLAAGENSKYS